MTCLHKWGHARLIICMFMFEPVHIHEVPKYTLLPQVFETNSITTSIFHGQNVAGIVTVTIFEQAT